MADSLWFYRGSEKMDNILGPKLRLEGQIEIEKAERSTEDI